MPPIHVMIKPASGNCNLRCKYCFYADVVQNRQEASYGIMDIGTLEAIVKSIIQNASGHCTFAFQGGEPTLAGLDFYQKLIELEKKYNTKGLIINNAIQTNGILIDEKWAKFLADNEFLVGLSLDGSKDLHDLYRVDQGGMGTFKTVMHTAQLFDKYKVKYNILTVITANSARRIGKVYGFFKRNNLRYQQYIPCIDPFDAGQGSSGYSLTPDLYAEFLINLFNLWYKDITSGKFIYIRYFENLVGMLAGIIPESCGMLGRCMKQLIIEADGSVYPCDFYVLDKYKIGNLVKDNLETIENNLKKIRFIEESMYIDEKCKKCRWANLCRGGCRRYREPMTDGHLSLNYYCEAYMKFFEHSYQKLSMLAKIVMQNKKRKSKHFTCN